MRGLIRSHAAEASARVLDVRSDDSDTRDFLYAPSLQILPELIDRRAVVPSVLDQGQDGACVGFALAAVINLTLASRRKNMPRGRAPSRAGARSRETVSARMLYEMAQRFDEWQGQSYAGTSLRGGMKAWSRMGATSERLWPNASKDREWTPARAADAARRPLGAYYRIADGNPPQLQAAIVDADAVLASIWVHSGWRHDQLRAPRAGDPLRLRRIDSRNGGSGLHAIALVGYTPEGLIVQNSWGTRWGTGGFALLSWDDWCANRQDAWVGRLAPTTFDAERKPKLYTGMFAGERSPDRAQTTTQGLDVPPDALPFFINTGDRGGLDGTHRLKTRAEDLPAMAARVRQQAPVAGRRHVMLYAHGGLDSEMDGVTTAARLFVECRAQNLTAYFFVWETGKWESVLGLLRSRDDAKGPSPAGFVIHDVLHGIGSAGRRLARDAQRAAGAAMSGGLRPVWKEMEGRAAGASAARGGARLFMTELFKAMRADSDRAPFVLHLAGHSAGCAYLAHVYDEVLRSALAAERANSRRFSLGSIHLMAPALSIVDAEAMLSDHGSLPVRRDRYRVYMLTPRNEENDNIAIYPSSVLTYVADHLESAERRIPLLGIRTDFDAHYASGRGPEPVAAMHATEHHIDFDDAGHEIDRIVREIAEGRYA